MSWESDWKKDKVERVEAFDVDAERADIEKQHPGDEYINSMLIGAMTARMKDAAETARELYEAYVKADRRKDALEFAAEHCLNSEDISTHGGSEVYELLYSTADVIEHALANGMTDNVLRKRLETEIADDEIAKGRFILPEERCKGDGEFSCDTFVGDMQDRCDTCQEIYEESDGLGLRELGQELTEDGWLPQ